jgi:phage gp36-like protein
MPYATPQDMVSRYDTRLLGDLVSDTGAPSVNILTDPNLAAVLDDATGSIDAAVYVGNRYKPEQMARLSETAAAFIRRLCCDLALIYLKRRRGRFDPEKDGALLKELNETLQSLRNGNNLLLLEEQTDAPASVTFLDRPQLVGVKRSTSIRASTRNYYPWNPDRDNYNNSGNWR